MYTRFTKLDTGELFAKDSKCYRYWGGGIH